MQFRPSKPASAAEDAFAFWPDAFGLAMMLVHERGRAEELCQDAFLRLAASKRPIDRTRSLRPLVLTTVRNLCLNDLRRRPHESLDASLASGFDPAERKLASPHENLAQSERRSAVQAALAKLRPAWREMVFLCDGLGCSYHEIASTVGCSEDVVRTTLSRARAKLRELLLPFAPEGSVTRTGTQAP